MMVIADIDVGDNSNRSVLQKMTIIGQQVLPALQQAGAGGVINPTAAASIAAKTIEALDLDPLEYLVDFNDPKFKVQAEQSRAKEQQAAEKQQQLTEKLAELDVALKEANVNFTNTQTKNALQDNTKQLMVALDKSYQEWAKLYIEAAKEGVELPERPNAGELLGIASSVIGDGLFDNEEFNEPKGPEEVEPNAQMNPMSPQRPM